MLFLLLLFIYGTASVFTAMASKSGIVIPLGGSRLPLPAFAGILSTLGNICIIFIVILYGKQGYITSLILLGTQFPLLIFNTLARHIMTSLPGIFGNVFTILAVTLIYRRNKKIAGLQSFEVSYLKDQQKYSQRLFEQTAIALVNAIDAKDTYSRGHSVRVAEYSRKIAEMMGKSEDECYKIYYTALLHDVGKIGISDAIINKKGKLTEEECEKIKSHPVLGNQILSGISEYPYLSIGAHFHHERYDGKGYPDKLKGEDIPEIARIIAVADAYDAMTSTRSYRDAISQQLVREEIVKNSGTQFDPKIAKIMQHIIDLDTEYQMKERTTIQELAGKSELSCGTYRSEVSEGIILMPYPTTIELDYTSDSSESWGDSGPTFILFDSLDGRVHQEDITIRELDYFEFGEIRCNGKTECRGARKMVTRTLTKSKESRRSKPNSSAKHFVVYGVRYKDHVLVRIDDGIKEYETTIALPDATRYSYLALTGENCQIFNVKIDKSEECIDEQTIPRIAEEVSYIDAPQGDIPNVQIDGFRLQSTDGIPITDGLTLKFHTRSLPTARLIWHCPYISIFHSKDGKVNGDGYCEYALIRLDGENWHGEGKAENDLTVTRTHAFSDWDIWKKTNKDGYEVSVSFSRRDNEIVVTTNNLGISIINSTIIQDHNTDIYVALTGDLCALTNIRIIRE